MERPSLRRSWRADVVGERGRGLREPARFALHRDKELAPFAEVARARFATWLSNSETSGHRFNTEQRAWLEAVVDHLAANLEIGPEDFEFSPFAQRGGLGAAHRVFGPKLEGVLKELTEIVAA